MATDTLNVPHYVEFVDEDGSTVQTAPDFEDYHAGLTWAIAEFGWDAIDAGDVHVQPIYSPFDDDGMSTPAVMAWVCLALIAVTLCAAVVWPS